MIPRHGPVNNRSSPHHLRFGSRRSGARRVARSGRSARQHEHSAVPARRNHPADDRIRSNRSVACGFGVAAKIKGETEVARRDADHAMSQHPVVVAAKQHVADHNLVGRYRRDGDHVAVVDRRVHTAALGTKPDEGAGRQAIVDDRAEKARISHKERCARERSTVSMLYR
jgi:hypothetical protein